MNDRERFIACVLGEPVDRPPYWLYWGPWGTTWQRWEAEGKPGLRHRPPLLHGPRYAAAFPTGQHRALPEAGARSSRRTTDFVIFYDDWGIKRRDYRHGESMSDFLEFPVKDREDWEDFRDRYPRPGRPAPPGGRLARGWLPEWMAKG